MNDSQACVALRRAQRLTAASSLSGGEFAISALASVDLTPHSPVGLTSPPPSTNV